MDGRVLVGDGDDWLTSQETSEPGDVLVTLRIILQANRPCIFDVQGRFACGCLAKSSGNAGHAAWRLKSRLRACGPKSAYADSPNPARHAPTQIQRFREKPHPAAYLWWRCQRGR